MIHKNRWGLALGLLLAIIHAVWSLAVYLIPTQLQKFLNWVFVLHAIRPVWILTKFDLTNALILIALTFVTGYIVGWLLAALINMLTREKARVEAIPTAKAKSKKKR